MFRLFTALFLFVAYVPAAFATQTVVILLGAPGSGKGTQADVVKAKMHLPHISTGDLIRQYLKEAPDNDQTVKQLKTYMDSGQLVPDSLIMQILQGRIHKPDAAQGFILDGFPRTVNQAESLNGLLKPDAKLLVIYFQVPDEMLLKRLEGRMTCAQCNTIYNRYFSPPKEDEICDLCKIKLSKRSDDNPETVKRRLEVFHQETAPLIQYYQQKGLLKTVDSTKDKSEVSHQVMQILNVPQ